MESSGIMIDSSAFQAYVELRRVATTYNIEDELKVPQLVVVGDTSAGKSMLVQNFLRFPCSFTAADIGTRCPVAYRLIHKADLRSGIKRIIHPPNLNDPSQLADHLKDLMEEIKTTEPTGFRTTAYSVQIESAEYTDFEIIDVPGLVTGNPDQTIQSTVENIVELYVRDPRYSIVLLKEASQIRQNANGALRIHELCTRSESRATNLPPRLDYKNDMITIQTKFDSLMQMRNGTAVNEKMRQSREDFGETYFVNMIFNGYCMTDQSYDENVDYIAKLPKLEKEMVDQWINELNRVAGQPPNNFQRFDQNNRSLIGIDVVRCQIQQLWLKAFRQALPRLSAVIRQQLTDARKNYDDALKLYNHQNPNDIRETYLAFIEDFQKTMCQYTSYQEEIFNVFPMNSYGKTYAEIEDDYQHSWDRYQPLVWRAHLRNDQLVRLEGGDKLQLDLKLIGASHFARINRVFDCMVLTYKSKDITDDEIVSASSILYGGVTDHSYLEKATRELLRHRIRNMFVVGIAWLTQMFMYMLDTFRENIKHRLLTSKRYNHIIRHVVFLSAVDREFHRTTRAWIRQTVQVIRHVCDSMAEYAHYDLTARLKKYIFLIPTHIQHDIFRTTVSGLQLTWSESNGEGEDDKVDIATVLEYIPKPKLLELLYSSASFLTADRDPQTLAHHENGRNVIDELYHATCSQILLTINSQFYSNVVKRIQEFGSPKLFGAPTRAESLSARLNRMELTQIDHIANTNTEELRQKIEDYENQISELTVAQKLLNDSITTMTSSVRGSSKTEQQYRGRNEAEDLKNATLQTLRKQRNRFEKQRDTTTQLHLERYSSAENLDSSITSRRINGNESDDEEQQLMNEIDEEQNKVCMSALYQRHDREDLQLGLSSEDDLHQDEL